MAHVSVKVTAMRLIFLLCTVLVAAPLSAERTGTASILPEVLKEAIECHDKAKTESDGYAQKCMELLKPYINDSPEACAYYGSAITVTANFCAKSNPLKALALLKEGSSLIDKAVKMDSSNFDVHILRLVNGIQVSSSSPVHRYRVIKEDVRWLMDNNRIESLSGETKAQVYYNCGLYEVKAENIDTALVYFEKAVEANPSGQSAVEAQKMIRRYEE